MGAGTDDVNLTGQPAEAIERAIASKRSHADLVVRELGRRRHHLTDWRWLLTHHAPAIAIGVGVLALGVGAAIATSVARSRARRRPTARLSRLRRAVARMVDQPERVASTPTATQRILVAALGPLAATSAKLLMKRLTQTGDHAGRGKNRP
jgi:hypothetical protein